MPSTRSPGPPLSFALAGRTRASYRTHAPTLNKNPPATHKPSIPRHEPSTIRPALVRKIAHQSPNPQRESRRLASQNCEPIPLAFGAFYGADAEKPPFLEGSKADRLPALRCLPVDEIKVAPAMIEAMKALLDSAFEMVDVELGVHTGPGVVGAAVVPAEVMQDLW